MAIITVFDPRVQTTYVYDSRSYRDKITKKPKSDRTLIGKLDDIGSIVSTKRKNRTTDQKSTGSCSAGTDTALEAVKNIIRGRDDEISSLKKQLSKTQKKLDSLLEAIGTLDEAASRAKKP